MEEEKYETGVEDNQEENTVFDFDNEKTEDGIEEKATEANESWRDWQRRQGWTSSVT